MIVIIGAGISGLSAARALKERGEKFILLEKEDHVGGLSTQYQDGGYWFDFSGHYFHFQDKPEIREYLLRTSPFKEYKRVSRTFLLDRYIPYPVQFHLSYLPAAVRDAVYQEIITRMEQRTIGREKHLGEFLEQHFGHTLVELFFEPFLTKYYRVALNEIAARMDRGSIPVPNKEKVEAGYRGQRFIDTGYNPVFYYPQTSTRDFIHRYAQPLMDQVRLKSVVTGVDLQKQTLATSEETVHYDHLISTMPLKELLQCTGDRDHLPLAQKLRHISTLVVNVMLKEKRKRFHWVYLAEKKFPFYRAGYYPHRQPPAVYLEKSVEPGYQMDPVAIKQETVWTLEQLGLIKSGEEIIFISYRYIPVSYIIFTREWANIVPPLLEQLRLRHVHSLGRYGMWNYTSMGDDVKTARECIDALYNK